MRMTGKFVLLLAAMLALFLGQAQAQRCLPGMKGVQLMADMVTVFIAGRTVMIGIRFRTCRFYLCQGRK